MKKSRCVGDCRPACTVRAGVFLLGFLGQWCISILVWRVEATPKFMLMCDSSDSWVSSGQADF